MPHEKALSLFREQAREDSVRRVAVPRAVSATDDAQAVASSKRAFAYPTTSGKLDWCT